MIINGMDVTNNSFCRILKKIDLTKEIDTEINFENKIIEDTNQPPCTSEKGTFLSPHSFSRELEHSYKKYGNPLFQNFLPIL